ncbi:hypothetical protein HDE_09463 [Halotydeus destructor]|nr:hypothetical protein HDE_09463 [Halotydeus destructor]
MRVTELITHILVIVSATSCAPITDSSGDTESKWRQVKETTPTCEAYPTIRGATYYNNNLMIFFNSSYVELTGMFNRNGLPEYPPTGLRVVPIGQSFKMTTGQVYSVFLTGKEIAFITYGPGPHNLRVVQRYTKVKKQGVVSYEFQGQQSTFEYFKYGRDVPIEFGATLGAEGGQASVIIMVKGSDTIWRQDSFSDGVLRTIGPLSGPVPSALTMLGNQLLAAFEGVVTLGDVSGSPSSRLFMPDYSSVYPYLWSGHLVGCPQNFCYDTKLDAADNRGSLVTLYRGHFSWTLDHWPPDGPPVSPERFSFSGVSGQVDSVATSDGKRLIFQRSKVFLFHGDQLVNVQAGDSNITDVGGAIFGHDKRSVYIFNGVKIFKYLLNDQTNQISFEWSKQIVLVQGLPGDIDAILDAQDAVYFFKDHWNYKGPSLNMFSGLDTHTRFTVEPQLSPVSLFRCEDSNYKTVPTLQNVFKANSHRDMVNLYWNKFKPRVVPEKDFPTTTSPGPTTTQLLTTVTLATTLTTPIYTSKYIFTLAANTTENYTSSIFQDDGRDGKDDPDDRTPDPAQGQDGGRGKKHGNWTLGIYLLFTTILLFLVGVFFFGRSRSRRKTTPGGRSSRSRSTMRSTYTVRPRNSRMSGKKRDVRNK